MILIWLPLLIVAMDRIIKLIVVSKMYEGESIPIIENIFHFTYILNPGAAFGLFPHNRIFFLSIATLVVILIWWWRKDILQEDLLVQIGVALFLGGALGNVWDRADTGLVVDYLDFRIWPIFNLADIAICVGVGLIIWDLLKVEMNKKRA